MNEVFVAAAERYLADLRRLLEKAIAKKDKKHSNGKTESELRDEYEAGIISLTQYEKKVAQLNGAVDQELEAYIQILEEEANHTAFRIELEKGGRAS